MSPASPTEDTEPVALAPTLQGNVDAELVRVRLMAAMFGQTVASPRFGRFELREQIGQGGMGVVYRAFDPQLERTVAVKLIDTSGFATSLRERALREARSLARLAHPNVITVFEAGLTDDRVWIAMEYVSGTTMRDYLQSTPRPDPTAILRHWIAVGRGLVAVHAAGLVHRDVKPSNVLIGDDGRARLIDFGLVSAPRGEPEAPGNTSTSGSSSDPAGRTIGFVGTRAYAAPEQLDAREVDAAADQYSLCVSIWESLAGRRPTPGAGVTTIAGVSPRIVRALTRGLSLAPQARFSSLAGLLAELEAAVSRPRRRLGLALGAAALGALVSGGAASHYFAAPGPPLCAVDADALVGTWDDNRRAALRERLTSDPAHPSFADTTLETVDTALDEWSRQWQEARRAACAATRLEGVQSEAALDLRNACLERKRRALKITLDTLLADGAGRARPLAAQAPGLLAALPGLEDCADPARLAEVEPLPGPGPRRDAVLRGYDELAGARALAASGALDAALARMHAFDRDNPEARGYLPLRLELQAFPAQLDVIRERTVRAVPELVQLAREAAGQRLDELAATLFVEAAGAAAGRWSKRELERSLVDEARAALRRLDRPDDPRQVALAEAEAGIAAQAGRFAEALAGYEQARARALARGHLDQAASQSLHVAAMLEELGRFDEARATLRSGRDEAERRWGAGAPTVGRYEFDLGLLALKTGDLDTTAAHLDRSEGIFVAALGEHAIWAARVRFVRAKLMMMRGRFTEALAAVDDALVTYAAELPPGHEQLAELHEARGVLRYFVGDPAGSLASYQEALRIQLEVSGPEHPTTARLRSNLGESLLALGRLDEAGESFALALAIHARTLPADHPALALPLKGRGQVALAQGRAREAVDDLERALSLQLAQGGEPLEIADLQFSLAQALTARDGARPARAAALARQAREGFEHRDMRERVAAIDAWLAG